MRACEDLRFVLRGALFDVGLDVELTFRLEEPRDFGEEHVAHDEPFGVTLFPPRIGKMKERATERAVGHEAWQRVLRVFGEHAGAGTKAALREARIDDRRPLA